MYLAQVLEVLLKVDICEFENTPILREMGNIIVALF